MFRNLWFSLAIIVLFNCNNQNEPLDTKAQALEQKLEAPKPDSPSQGSFWQTAQDDVLIQFMVKNLSDEEKISQIFLVSWPGTEVDQNLLAWIEKKNIGGIKIFGWNAGDPAQLAQTITRYQSSALKNPNGIPLFVATDQEGGWVRHIKKGTSQSAGNMGLGADAVPGDAFLSGYYIARELRYMGVNMNFAPTVDLLTNDDAHVIGPRAFGDDPNLASILSLAFFNGQEKTRVISTAKHFPGHGNALGDSHGVLPIVNDGEDILEGREWMPYKKLFSEGLASVLSGHLNFPKLSGDDRPASLSRKILTDILRNKLGFQGLIMTDDLYMGGALDYGTKKGWSLGQIIYEAIHAGNDMVMLSRTPELNDATFNYILNRYKTDAEFAKEINDSLKRILKVKLSYLKPNDRVPFKPDLGELNAVLKDKASSDFFTDQAFRSVSLLTQEFHTIETTKKVLVVSQSNDFIRAMEKEYKNIQFVPMNYDPFYGIDTVIAKDLISRTPNFDEIVVCIANPYGGSLIDQLEPIAKKLTIVSSLSPVYIRKTPWVRNAIAVYGYNKESMEAGVKILSGKAKPFAKTPLQGFN